MKITRDQFVRGFNAIQASFDRQRAMNQAAKMAGIEDYDHGQDPVAFELQRQLEERCADIDEGQPGGSAISYGLHEGHIVTPGVGRESFRMNTAEAVWRWWEETKTGPFGLAANGPTSLTRYDITAYGGCECCGAELETEKNKQGDWVKYNDVVALFAGEVRS